MMSHLILESQSKAFFFYFNPNLNSIITSQVVFVFRQLFPTVAIADLVLYYNKHFITCHICKCKGKNYKKIARETTKKITSIVKNYQNYRYSYIKKNKDIKQRNKTKR